MTKTISVVLLAIFAFFVVVILLGAFWALLVMLLWNAVVPDLFGLSVISFWQAWGLYFLTSLLFKSFSVQIKS